MNSLELFEAYGRARHASAMVEMEAAYPSTHQRILRKQRKARAHLGIMQNSASGYQGALSSARTSRRIRLAVNQSFLGASHKGGRPATRYRNFIDLLKRRTGTMTANQAIRIGRAHGLDMLVGVGTSTMSGGGAGVYPIYDRPQAIVDKIALGRTDRIFGVKRTMPAIISHEFGEVTAIQEMAGWRGSENLALRLGHQSRHAVLAEYRAAAATGGLLHGKTGAREALLTAIDIRAAATKYDIDNFNRTFSLNPHDIKHDASRRAAATELEVMSRRIKSSVHSSIRRDMMSILPDPQETILGSVPRLEASSRGKPLRQEPMQKITAIRPTPKRPSGARTGSKVPPPPPSKVRAWTKRAMDHPHSGKFGAILAGAAAVAVLWSLFGDKKTPDRQASWGSGHAGLVGHDYNRRHMSHIVDQRTRYGALFPMAANVAPEPHHNIAARTAYSGGSYA